MDCPTRENNQNFPPKEEQENNCRTESLYLHLLSDSPEGKISVFYKIDSSGDEAANFNQKPMLIPVKVPSNLPQIGFGSAICDSILYLFGGWVDRCSNWSKEVCYLDLAVASCNKEESTSLVPLKFEKHKMNAFRAFPLTLTIGKKIYIFGSQKPGYGEFPSDMHPIEWGEVFNTEDKLFKLTSRPPLNLFSGRFIGVTAIIEKDKILFATDNFSDWYIYDVSTDLWTHTRRDDKPVSPFCLCSMRSPVVGNYVLLYGTGKICAFDIDKNQFLENNISLLEYTLFDDGVTILNGAIHHRGGWKFSVVFGDEAGYLVRFVYVISFEIENPEYCGELNIKAGTINIVDHVVRGDTFVDSLLWSNQIVPSGNTNNGKQLKSNFIVGGASSSVTTHVDDGCMMDDYGATSRPELSKFRREVAELSKLRRKEAALDKEMFEMRREINFLIAEISKLEEKLSKGVPGHDYYLDSFGGLERELSSNMGSSVTSHVDDDCMMDDYGATSRPELSKFRRELAGLSKLRRKEAVLDKEMFEMRLQKNFLIAEISKLKENLFKGVRGYDFYLDSLERSERELSSIL